MLREKEPGQSLYFSDNKLHFILGRDAAEEALGENFERMALVGSVSTSASRNFQLRVGIWYHGVCF